MRKHENRETPEWKTLRGLHWVTMITQRTIAKNVNGEKCKIPSEKGDVRPNSVIKR